jgi:hypothetical protein
VIALSEEKYINTQGTTMQYSLYNEMVACADKKIEADRYMEQHKKSKQESDTIYQDIQKGTTFFEISEIVDEAISEVEEYLQQNPLTSRSKQEYLLTYCKVLRDDIDAYQRKPIVDKLVEVAQNMRSMKEFLEALKRKVS